MKSIVAFTLVLARASAIRVSAARVSAIGALAIGAAAILLADAGTSAAWAQAASNDNLTGINVARRDDSLRNQIVAAEQAVKKEDWGAALLAWQALGRSGVDAAPAQLCRLYFDARQGSFEPATVTDWCRRAAGAGDADGLYRMGLLYLVGLGVPKNVDQAYAFCAAAQEKGGQEKGAQQTDAQVPAKFCLAAVAAEQAHAASATLADLRIRRPAASPPNSIAAKPGASPREMCDRAFAAIGVPFDAVAVTRWCGEAAIGGDANALHRIGLMHLAGLAVQLGGQAGGTRDLDAAGRDCANANVQGGGHVSAAFCLAAVTEERRSLGAAAQGLGSAGDQVNGRPLPATLPDPFAADRNLDERHRTAGGLDYTCRKLADWGRFEAPGLVILQPRDKLFGRAILAYGRRDFDELGRAAMACSDALATGPGTADLQRDLDAFRTSMADLRVRQGSLLGEHQQASTEAAQLARDQRQFVRDQQTQMSEVRVVASLPTAPEQACVEEIRRGVAGSLIGEQTTLEIRHSNRTEIGSNLVVRGEARVMETAGGQWREVREFAPYTCVFNGRTLVTSVLSSPALGYKQTQAAPQ